ncbi:hypothetical protein [Shigella flexneri]|uniref:hypothetical protein n=1 Tax=Shigella flexneri TaxID=623 RepID=UPI00374DD5E4
MKSVMPELITVEELAFALKKTVKSIRSDATRNPKCLPPRCRLPGNKRLLWRREDVKDWIDKSVESKTENDDIAKEINRFQRKRGRPPKPKPRK